MGILDDLTKAIHRYANPEQYQGFDQPQQAARSAPLALELNETATVTLDGAGNGIARLSPYGPRNGGLSWDLTQVVVSVATIVNEAQASLYLSYGIQESSPSTLVAQTATGSSGDTCAMSQTIRPGDWLSVRWTGGDAGAVATFRVSGQINPP